MRISVVSSHAHNLFGQVVLARLFSVARSCSLMAFRRRLVPFRSEEQPASIYLLPQGPTFFPPRFRRQTFGRRWDAIGVPRSRRPSLLFGTTYGSIVFILGGELLLATWHWLSILPHPIIAGKGSSLRKSLGTCTQSRTGSVPYKVDLLSVCGIGYLSRRVSFPPTSST